MTGGEIMRGFLKNGGLLALVLVLMMVLVLVLPVHAAANRGPIELPMIPGTPSTTKPTTEPATEPVTDPATEPATDPVTEPATTVPQETVPECLSYEIVDGEVTITDCDTNASGELIIPATIEGYPVTAIGDKAFTGSNSLTSVIIGNSVTSIGDFAFRECFSLTSVSIGNSVTSIGDWAFRDCPNLVYHIWDTGKYLGNEENPHLVLMDTTSENITSITIHKDTKIIGYSACASCSALCTVTVPDGVKHIGNRAFSGCNSLTSIRIGDGLTGMGYGVFSACRNLTEILVGVNNACFSSDSYGVLFNKDKTVLYCAPRSLSGSYTVPDGVIEISDAFDNCLLMTALILPKGLITIDSGAFSYCCNLSSMVIPDSVVSIGTGVFHNCLIEDIYYTGTPEQWSGITIGDNNYSLADATIHANYIPTVIKTHPMDQNAVAGNNVKLTVLATGGSLAYQWQYRTSANGEWKNASASGNKTSVLTVPVTTARNGYQYRCKIIDGFGLEVYTDFAELSVFGINTQPENKYLPAGKTAKFMVKATGEGLTYQWQYRASAKGSWKNTTATGNKTATLSVPVTAARNNYQYRCKVTDQEGSVVYSNAATLKVVTLKVTTQPANKYLPAGKTAKFTVKVSGTGLKYQWQYRTSSSGSWKNASAAGNKTATLSVPATATRNGYQYRCKITDQYGNVIYSNAATLKIVTLKITTQPSSMTLAKGKTATFKVVAKGTDITYQWQYRTSAKGTWKKASATGNKTATLKVPVTAARNGYQYRCVITDKYGNVVRSAAATLKVK